MINIIGDMSHAELYIQYGIAGMEYGKKVEFASKDIISPGVYLDNRKFPSHPESWHRMLERVQGLAGTVRLDAIATVETGANVHGGALAYLMHLPLYTVRKAEKGHGLGGRVTGDLSVLDGRRVLLIEDHGTTGVSTISAASALRHEGATVEHVVFLSVYGFSELEQQLEGAGLKGHTVVAFSSILEAARENGLLTRSGYEELIRAWLRDPRAKWSWPS